jgi:maltokinase
VNGRWSGLSSFDAAEALRSWLPGQRWFADKGRPLESVRVMAAEPFTGSAEEPAGALAVVRADFADGRGPADYQVPLGARAAVPVGLRAAAVVQVAGSVFYDALADHELVRALVRRIAGGARHGGLRFETEPPGFQPPGDGTFRQLAVEQSNSSVVLDETYLLKVFRRLHAGTNPDVELQRMLRAAGSQQVPRLAGSVTGRLGRRTATFAVLQEFIPDAAPGWPEALESARSFSDGAVPEDHFAAEAARIGESVARVHADLARVGGSTLVGREGLRALVAEMTARLDDAVRLAPGQIGARRGRIAEVFEAVSGLAPDAVGPVQRVHGDLHLGQVLRAGARDAAAGRWLLIDFEGEPATALERRRAAHPPVRDVAGMLRSFDYAAHHGLGSADPGRRAAAGRWAARSQDAFCSGYGRIAGRDPRESGALLAAYQLDKAVYEVCYEIRNRPDWAWIPLGAVDRLLGNPAPERAPAV